jgi:hypothetical protein
MQTMHRSEVGFAPSLVTDIEIGDWGSELVLSCLDDPLTRRGYEVVFRGCREIRWSLYDAASDATEADVIGFCAGTPEHAEPAVLTTDLFELSVLYDRVEIRQRTRNPS